MAGRKPLKRKMVEDLLKRKRAYERYFKSKEGTAKEGQEVVMDNQAQNAYTALIKEIFRMAGELAAETKENEDVRQLAADILKSEYGIQR